MRYFFAERAGFPIAGQRFVIHDIVGGTAVGTFATDDSVLIQTFLDLAASKKSSVVEISQEDFELCRKKKPPGPELWSPLSVEMPKALPQALVGQGALVANEGAPEGSAIVAPVVDGVNEAIQLGSVDAPPAPPASAETAKASEPGEPPAPQNRTPPKPGRANRN